MLVIIVILGLIVFTIAGIGLYCEAAANNAPSRMASAVIAGMMIAAGPLGIALCVTTAIPASEISIVASSTVSVYSNDENVVPVFYGDYSAIMILDAPSLRSYGVNIRTFSIIEGGVYTEPTLVIYIYDRDAWSFIGCRTQSTVLFIPDGYTYIEDVLVFNLNRRSWV